MNARLVLVLLFLGLALAIWPTPLKLPWGYTIALCAETAALLLYKQLAPRARNAGALDRLHYVLLTAEVGFHSAMVYYLGGVSWLGAIAYIYAILYGVAFLNRWQTVVFTAGVAAVALTLFSLEGAGVLPHQSFLPQGPERYRDPRFLAVSAIMFPGVLGTIAFWVAWLGSEMRRERDDALRANQELIWVQAQMRALNEELERKVEERTRALLARAELDSLTGLLNRGAVTRRGQEMLMLAQRGNRPLALVMADADDFKACNDRGGHLYGDNVLQALAEALKSGCRGSDIVGRMGGDEFLIILPDASLRGALHFCRRAVRRIADWKTRRAQEGLPVPSLSFGVAAYPDHGSEMEEIIRVADHALYEAKAAGGGCWKVGACSETFVAGKAAGGTKVGA